jgi:hypothetical protein
MRLPLEMLTCGEVTETLVSAALLRRPDVTGTVHQEVIRSIVSVGPMTFILSLVRGKSLLKFQTS